MTVRGLVVLAGVVCVAVASAHAQSVVGADAVERFTPGDGAGYGADYFPANVLGLPDTSARADVPTIDPRQILGLGIGGEIILRFDSGAIVDRPGPDFTVFENAFVYEIGGKQRVYAEPAQVAVSRDGVHYVAFAFDSLTLHGCAGVTPTNGDRDPGDPAVSGGDAFDLATLDIDSVRYVRLHDVTAVVKSNRASPFWDATLNGFDLDAVVAVHHAAVPATSAVATAAEGAGVTLTPNPVRTDAAFHLVLPHPTTVGVRLLDGLGREVMRPLSVPLGSGEQRIHLDASSLACEVYYATIAFDDVPWRTLRVLVLR